MGTLVACVYAMIYYLYHGETILLLPWYHSSLRYYRHFIDDMLTIWIPMEDDPEKVLTAFKLTSLSLSLGQLSMRDFHAGTILPALSLCPLFLISVLLLSCKIVLAGTHLSWDIWAIYGRESSNNISTFLAVVQMAK
jgi:hypothetical protein